MQCLSCFRRINKSTIDSEFERKSLKGMNKKKRKLSKKSYFYFFFSKRNNNSRIQKASERKTDCKERACVNANS